MIESSRFDAASRIIRNSARCIEETMPMGRILPKCPKGEIQALAQLEIIENPCGE